MSRRAQSRWLASGCLLVACAVLGTLTLAAIGYATGTRAFILGLMLAVTPVPFYIAFALWVDRFEPEPPWLLAIAFLWGASIAVFIAMVFNTLAGSIFAAAAGAPASSALTSVLAAPFVEELAKGAALLLLFLWRRDELDNVTDGIVYAGMIGLGFAMTENVQYYGNAIAQTGEAAGIVFARGVMSPFSHPLYTSMTGIGFGLARESDRRAVKWLAPIAGLGVAMLLHAIWNLSASFGIIFLAAYFAIMVPALIAVIAIAYFSLRREAKIIRTHLECIVADGVLSAGDLAIVTSVRGRVKASARALFTGGVRKWIARRRFHALATELAFHSWRCSREPHEDAAALHAQLLVAVRAAREAA